MNAARKLRASWRTAAAAMGRSAGISLGIASAAYVRLALRAPWLPLLAGVREWPQEVENLLGYSLETSARIRLARKRFLLRLLMRSPVLRSLPPPRAIEVRGREHLEAALRGGRGVVLATAHFGVPGFVRPVVEAAGARLIFPRWRPATSEDPRVGDDPWERVRTVRKLRDELARNHACLIVVDGPFGAQTRVPFLRGELTLGTTAFVFARQTGAPLVPFFTVVPPSWRARVELLAPMAETDTPERAANEFACLYAGFVKRYPCQLQHLR